MKNSNCNRLNIGDKKKLTVDSEIKIEVPGRICLFGDKVDLLEKPVIGATVNALMYTTLSKRNDNIVEIASEDLDFSKIYNLEDPPDFNHPLGYWSAVINRLKDKISGFKAVVKSDIPIGSGLSSSAALTISLIKGLMKLFSIEMSVDEIAELAYNCEHHDLGIMCGRLDQYTIAYGGIVHIETGDTPKVTRIPLKSLPVVVGDSQEERHASIVLNRIKSQIREGEPYILDAFSKIEKIVEEGKDALINKDFKRVGELMTMQQEQENILNASTEKLNLMCEESIRSGAYGAKLMGAGGGGCMVAVCNNNSQKVCDALEKIGAKPWIFEIYNY